VFRNDVLHQISKMVIPRQHDTALHRWYCTPASISDKKTVLIDIKDESVSDVKGEST